MLPAWGAVVHGDHPVLFHQRGSGEALVFGIRVDAVGQVTPMDQVGRDGVAPVLSRNLGWVGLVEQVPIPLPITEAVGVVEPRFRVDVMIGGAMPVAGIGCP